MNRISQESWELLRSKLSPDDDAAFWAAALGAVAGDVETFDVGRLGKREIFMRIGACSHWLRPHQTRWTASGGFAEPAGYGGNRFRGGLPELDWSILVRRDEATGAWRPADRVSSKRARVLRVALPTRTVRHRQAAFRTIWSAAPDGEERARRYGFRNVDGRWECVARDGF